MFLTVRFAAATDALEIHSIYAPVVTNTAVSFAESPLHEKFGFENVGGLDGIGYELGAWRDVGWWQMCLQGRSGAPRSPTPLRCIEMSEAGHAALRPSPADL